MHEICIIMAHAGFLSYVTHHCIFTILYLKAIFRGLLSCNIRHLWIRQTSHSLWVHNKILISKLQPIMLLSSAQKLCLEFLLKLSFHYSILRLPDYCTNISDCSLHQKRFYLEVFWYKCGSHVHCIHFTAEFWHEHYRCN